MYKGYKVGDKIKRKDGSIRVITLYDLLAALGAADLANKVAEKVKIPVIGIGAGNKVDGQVLVIHDMLGMTKEFNPRFLRRYMNLYDDMIKAISKYSKDVKNGNFPNSKEQY